MQGCETRAEPDGPTGWTVDRSFKRLDSRIGAVLEGEPRWAGKNRILNREPLLNREPEQVLENRLAGDFAREGGRR